MSSRRGIALAAAIVVGVVAATNWDALGMANGPTCTVGVQGTAASLEVRGWTANQACAAFEAETPGTYRYSGPLTTPVVCQYEIRSNRFTVHDEGVLKLIGNAACVALRAAKSDAEIASTLATPAPTAPPPTPRPTSAPTFTPAPTFAIPFSTPTLSGCQVGIVGRNAAVTVVGGAPDPVCRTVTQVIYLPAGTQWYALARVSPVLPAAADAACYQEAVGGTLVVTDTGSRTLGASICWQLQITNLNTGTRLPTCGLQVSGHDATIAVFGTTAASECMRLQQNLPIPKTWQWVRVGVDLGPFGASTICRSPLASGQVEVWDTGGATYGSQICSWLP